MNSYFDFQVSTQESHSLALTFKICFCSSTYPYCYNMDMKVFIFGAGASLGSQDLEIPETHLRAPLINNLFDSQYNTHAAEVRVSYSRLDELKKLIGDESLEEWLTKEWTRLDELNSKEALAQGRKLFGDLALYIWWLMVRVSTTYTENNGYYLFLQKLAQLDDKEEKAYVNFNYDLLLDKAFNGLYGYNLSSTIENYTTHNYLKPHGSVNWFVNQRPTDERIPQVDGGYGQRDILLNRVASNMFRGEVMQKQLKIIDPANTQLYNIDDLFARLYTGGDFGFPLVLLPLSTKMDDLIDGFMDRMRAEFPRIFGPATSIYVIGYRANDALFQEMMIHVKQGTKLYVVGRDTAVDIQKEILSKNSKLVAGDVYSKGFIDFIDKMK